MKYVFPALTVILLIILVGAGAYFLGRQTKPTETPTNSSNVQTTPVNTTPTLSPTTSQQKTVIAGGVLSFPKYQVTLPEGWVSEREQGQDMDKLTLTKLGYKITISEAAFGGGGCLYAGDPPSEMAQTYTAYTEINNPNGYIFRRSGGDVSGGQRWWTLCQRQNEGSFGTPTIFGHISISGPVTTDASIVAEIDSMFSSIKKI